MPPNPHPVSASTEGCATLGATFLCLVSVLRAAAPQLQPLLLFEFSNFAWCILPWAESEPAQHVRVTNPSAWSICVLSLQDTRKALGTRAGKHVLEWKGCRFPPGKANSSSLSLPRMK